MFRESAKLGYFLIVPRKPLNSTITCSYCAGFETSKAGFAKTKQRYYCRSCRRFFSENSKPKTSSVVRSSNRQLPTEGNLILKLVALAQRLGRTPTTTDIAEHSKKRQISSLDDYYAAFGSFNNALSRAKLPLNYNQEFDKEKLIGELKTLHAKLKRPIFGKDVLAARKREEVSSIYHFQRAFGSVPLAIAAAGAGKKTFTRAEMIEILRQIDSGLDRPLLEADIDKFHRSGKAPSKRAFEREFGGLAKARMAANVKNTYQKEERGTRNWQKYTQKELIEQLKLLAEEVGRKPTGREINQASKQGKCASEVTFSSMFGSFRDACRRAGLS